MKDVPDDKGVYIRVTPGMFVKPPYITCPECGKESFGVLVISGHQYSRRCKSCYFPTPPKQYHPPTRLPSLNKKIVYLDQFVVSKIMFSLNPNSCKYGEDPHEKFWKAAFAKLDVLAKKQLLVCPESQFHEYEALPSESFSALRQIYEHLSYGVSFARANHIKARQICDSFYDWLAGEREPARINDRRMYLRRDVTAWTDHFSVTVRIPENPSFVEELRSIRESVDSGVKEVFSRWQTQRDRGFQDWVSAETRSYGDCYVGGLVRQALQLGEAERQFVENGICTPEMLNLAFPSHESIVMLALRSKLIADGYGEDLWLPKIMEYFGSENFAQVPFVKISSHIWATVADRAAHRGQKKPPSRGFFNDVGFLSVFMPYCDAMFVDKECHGILREKTMESICSALGTRFFSLSNREEMFEYLDEIENNATQEHMALLQEVYGDLYLEPYVTLFETQRDD